MNKPLRRTADDGTRFGVFNQGSGDYVASIDATGTHYAPAQYTSLPSWSRAQAERELRLAVEQYEHNLWRNGG